MPKNSKKTIRTQSIVYDNQSRFCGKGVGLGLFPSDSLESQSKDFDVIAHAAAPLGVERLFKILWKSFGQFLRNLKFSLKGWEKKRYGCKVVQNFFRLLRGYGRDRKSKCYSRGSMLFHFKIIVLNTIISNKH